MQACLFCSYSPEYNIRKAGRCLLPQRNLGTGTVASMSSPPPSLSPPLSSTRKTHAFNHFILTDLTALPKGDRLKSGHSSLPQPRWELEKVPESLFCVQWERCDSGADLLDVFSTCLYCHGQGIHSNAVQGVILPVLNKTPLILN